MQMLEKEPQAVASEAATVVDPDLPEKTRLLLEEAEQDPWLIGHGAMSVGGTVAWAAGMCSVVLGPLAVLWWVTSPDDDDATFADSAWLAFRDDIYSFVELTLLVGIGTAFFFVASRGLEASAHNQRVRKWSQARKRCVRPKEVNDEARLLLARAQRAKGTVLASSVHRLDLIDRQRNELTLPQQEWELAEALLEYSRLAQAEPKDLTGAKAIALLDSRRKALRTSLAGIERRIAALEVYAEQVVEADLRHREMQQIQALSEGSNDILELLARTARDDLAVAELQGMTGEAAAVAATFTAALESAKEAAFAALPTGEAA